MENGLQGKKIGFIGGGKMAEAIFSGVLKAKVAAPEDVYIMDISASRLEYLQKTYGIQPAASSEALIDAVEVVVLSIKPQDARNLLTQIAPKFVAGKHTLLSIMGGVTLEFLESFVQNVPVIRIMPNTPMVTQEGVAGIALGKLAGKAEEEIALAIFNAVGISFVLPESKIDPLTGVSGCGPAFCAMFIQAMADGGVELGLSRDMAIQLAAQTLVGTGKMVLAGEHPEILKDNVCSPAGGTIAGTHILEQQAFRGAVADAVVGAVERMREVGKKA